MRQRFGPINSKQGHRRLNVLFSRARIRIGLFASFGSEDVKPTETSKEGVHVLKRYLEYTESEGRAAVQLIGGEADSEFETEVAIRLRARGHTVDMQVGVSGFKIDLGVRHPDHPEMFLAGIECDGAQYHSSKSARDRDRLREEVLRGLGWNIVRVWSTDWFDNPDAQTEKLLKRLEELRTKPMSAFQDYRLGPTYLPAIEVALTEQSETETDDDIDGQASFDSIAEHAISDLHVETEDDQFEGSSSLTVDQAYEALAAFRQKVIRPSASNWEPHRSILREAMIETFVRQRISDPDDWFTRVPHYQRSGTDPVEKRLYLDRICSVVDRIGATAVQKPLGQSSSSSPTNATTGKAQVNQMPEPYVVTDFAAAGLKPDQNRFYEASYRPALRQLIDHVIRTEGPLYGDILAVRIARAHGMERTGSTIQKMVTDAVGTRFPRSREDERDVFWPEGSVTDRPVPFRVSADGSRSHADTPIAELASLAQPYLRVRLSDDQIIEKLAEQFGLQRVRAATRARFGSAIAIAKMSGAS
jgi:very-short-patch-repair endonuclease